MLDKLLNRLHYSQISTKITLIFAVCFFALLTLTNVLAWYGIYYALYQQAERSLEVSIENTEELLNKIEQDTSVDVNTIRDPLVPGVVLRVATMQGTIFIDTNPRYPSNENFQKHILNHKPIWADSNVDIAQIGNSLICCSKTTFTHENDTVNLFFFRTITAEINLLEQLKNVLIIIDIIGMIFAISTGYIISRKILRPISTITKTAQNIAVENMSTRIPIAPVQDELTDLAATFNNMLDRLQVGIQQQQRFVSDASHELRTPATVIRGYSDLLNRWGSSDPEILAESIEAISSEAENMQHLIEQLLFLARSDQNRQPLNFEVLNLTEMIADIFHKMKIVTHTHNVELLHNEDAKVYGDKVAVRQMIRIFLDNAIKYTPEGGTVSIDSINRGGFVKISISDTGIGISPENQQKVFDRFFRVQNSDGNKAVSGTGLGLSIAKWIVDQHNFELSLESQLDVGTTITVIMPIAN